MIKKNNLMLIGFIFIIIIILRVVFEYNINDDRIKDIMITSLTAISFFIVIELLNYNILNKLNKINDEIKSESQRDIYYNNIYEFKKKSIFFRGVFTLILIAYIFLLRSSLANDIITIASLAISILEDDLSDIVCYRVLD